MLKPTILSISLLTIMASAAVSPALAKISQAFPDSGPTLIKLILTLPSVIIIPFSLLSGWLVLKLKKRLILLIGLVIYCLGGIGGGFAGNMTELLIIRAFLGIGVGLIMPLSTTLIVDFFAGEQRTRMMGLSGSVNNLGGVLFLITSGWLACLNWRFSFAVYGLSVISIIMALLWLPEPPQVSSPEKVKTKLPSEIFICMVWGVLMMIAFYAVPTNLALFIESERKMCETQKPLFRNKAEFEGHLQKGTLSEMTIQILKDNGILVSKEAQLLPQQPGKEWLIRDKKKNYIVKKEDNKLMIYAERLGRPAIAGYALSAMTLAGVISGLILVFITKLLGRYTVLVALSLMGIGFGILSQAASLLMIFIAVPFIGLSGGILMPSLILHVSKIVSPFSRAFAMALVGSSIFLGQFLSPLALKAVSFISGSDTFTFRFGFLAVSLFMASLIGFILLKRPLIRNNLERSEQL